jgi:Fe-S oxidoreductase
MINKKTEEFRRLENNDSEIAELRIEENRIKNLLLPIIEKKYERRKKLAVDSGLAVRRVEDMISEYPESYFVINFCDRMTVYTNQEHLDEKYTYCDNCKLFISGDLPQERYNDMRNHGLHGRESVLYSCPICRINIGEKVIRFS